MLNRGNASIGVGFFSWEGQYRGEQPIKWIFLKKNPLKVIIKNLEFLLLQLRKHFYFLDFNTMTKIFADPIPDIISCL